MYNRTNWEKKELQYPPFNEHCMQHIFTMDVYQINSDFWWHWFLGAGRCATKASICGAASPTPRPSNCLDSFWSVGIVCRLSGQFPDYPDSFWIVRTVSGLSGKFLDYPDSFLIVRTVSEFFRKFLDYSDNYLDSLGNFLVIWIVFSLFWDRYELKRGNIYIIAKTFRILAKTFRTAMTRWQGFCDSVGSHWGAVGTTHELICEVMVITEKTNLSLNEIFTFLCVVDQSIQLVSPHLDSSAHICLLVRAL